MAQAKIALVTGGGSGIGRAAALGLQAAGYTVIVAGRRSAELQQTVSLASPDGGSLTAIPADVSDPASVDALFAAIKDRYVRLDVLFNNAGIGAPPKPRFPM